MTERRTDVASQGFAPVQLRALIWVVLSVLAALLAWFGFRGYLNPELLFHFANSLYC
jgi:hypothetical protein